VWFTLPPKRRSGRTLLLLNPQDLNWRRVCFATTRTTFPRRVGLPDSRRPPPDHSKGGRAQDVSIRPSPRTSRHSPIIGSSPSDSRIVCDRCLLLTTRARECKRRQSTRPTDGCSPRSTPENCTPLLILKCSAKGACRRDANACAYLSPLLVW
jgi:hypothetical protein